MNEKNSETPQGSGVAVLLIPEPGDTMHPSSPWLLGWMEFEPLRAEVSR